MNPTVDDKKQAGPNGMQFRHKPIRSLHHLPRIAGAASLCSWIRPTSFDPQKTRHLEKCRAFCF